MDVFKLHRHLIRDFGTYIRSFINIADEGTCDQIVHESEISHTDPKSNPCRLAGLALSILGGQNVVQSLASFVD